MIGRFGAKTGAFISSTTVARPGREDKDQH